MKIILGAFVLIEKTKEKQGRILNALDVVCTDSGLASLTIPNIVENLGVRAFNTYTNLKSLTIPNKATNLGFRFCTNCKSLTSLTIPNSVTEIGYSAFRGCKSR